MPTLSIFSKIKDFLLNPESSILPKIIGTVLIVLVGWIAVGIITKILRNALTKAKTKLDISLINFFVTAANICLKLLIVLSALNNLGISTTGLIAAFSAAAVAISLALKDSLGNIASGIIILISRPFSTGDLIDAGGSLGTVARIDMIHTTLRTPDNRLIVIPNGQLMNMTITDYSKEPTRRLDLTFGISYDNDPEKAKAIIMDTVKAHPMSLNEPEPFVRVSEHADSAVIITLRVWCKTENYWTLHFDLLEQVRTAFDKNGISIPYNQLDVHVVNNEK